MKTDFTRDKRSNALINTNITALQSRRDQKRQQSENRRMQEDIDLLKEKLETIERLILEGFKKR